MIFCERHKGPSPETTARRVREALAWSCLCVMERALQAKAALWLKEAPRPLIVDAVNAAVLRESVATVVEYYKAHIPEGALYAGWEQPTMRFVYPLWRHVQKQPCPHRTPEGCKMCSKKTGCLRTSNDYPD